MYVWSEVLLSFVCVCVCVRRIFGCAVIGQSLAPPLPLPGAHPRLRMDPALLRTDGADGPDIQQVLSINQIRCIRANNDYVDRPVALEPASQSGIFYAHDDRHHFPIRILVLTTPSAVPHAPGTQPHPTTITRLPRETLQECRTATYLSGCPLGAQWWKKWDKPGQCHLTSERERKRERQSETGRVTETKWMRTFYGSLATGRSLCSVSASTSVCVIPLPLPVT